MRLLEEFWYGNIEPTEYDTNACKEYKEVLHLITRNEEKLQATAFRMQYPFHAGAVPPHKAICNIRHTILP